MPAKQTEKSKVPEVVVYSTPTCPYCHAVKDFLKANNVEFNDVDVSKDPKAAEEMIESSGQIQDACKRCFRVFVQNSYSEKMPEWFG